MIVLSACSFPTAPSSSARTTDAALADATRTLDAPAVTVPPSEFCQPTSGTAQNHVMACFEFEDTADDGSIHHLIAHTTDVSFVPGQIGKALHFASTSAADFDDSPAFDATSLTIELWVNPSANRPATANLLDVNNQYAFQLKSNGDLHCLLNGGKSLDGNAKLAANQWTHVACTYDAATGESLIYANGSQVNSDNASDNSPLATDGTTGLSLAADNPPSAGDRAPMVGLLDQVRLLDYARAAADICTDSGSSACK